MFDVFISHAQSTIPLVRQIADALRALGHTVWWDDELPVHQSFWAVIEARVRDAKAVVVIWSRDAVESTGVRAEAEIAQKAGTLVQVSVEGTAPPLPFNQIQYADMSGWNGDVNAAGWRKVVASVNELAGAQRPAVAPSATTPKPSPPAAPHKRLFPSLILGAVAVAGGAIWYGMSMQHSSQFNSDSGASNKTAAPNDPATADDAFANRPAIAVLPFENRSDDPKHAIFADGLAEDLITRLSAWRAFPVIARGSSFQYRGDVDIKRVAKDLNVRYVVQGSVQRTADRIRVSAQLVDAQTSNSIWSQAYDRPITDIFDLQDELSAAIVAPLVGDLTRAEANRAQQRGTRNVEAWNLYLLGEQHLLQKITPTHTTEARALLEQAIALEPQFASAHARLSNAYFWEGQFGPADSLEHNLALSRESARRAVELDPRDPLAHSALGLVMLVSKDTANGLASAQRAVDLNPSSPEAWNQLGYAKLLALDPKGCIAANERSLRLDPQSFVWGVEENLSEAYWQLGQYDVGLEHANKSVSAQPDFYWGHVDVALNAAGLGRLDDARAAIAKARALQPDLSQALIDQRSGLTDAALIARRSAALHAAGLD